MVKRGDFLSFENLSIKVNEFHEKLILMGKEHDAENSYVLKEIETWRGDFKFLLGVRANDSHIVLAPMASWGKNLTNPVQ